MRKDLILNKPSFNIKFKKNPNEIIQILNKPGLSKRYTLQVSTFLLKIVIFFKKSNIYNC